MVTHLNRNTDPNMENKRRNIIALYLWNNSITPNMMNKQRPQYSHMAKAQGMNGTLSRTMSAVCKFKRSGLVKFVGDLLMRAKWVLLLRGAITDREATFSSLDHHHHEVCLKVLMELTGKWREDEHVWNPIMYYHHDYCRDPSGEQKVYERHERLPWFRVDIVPMALLLLRPGHDVAGARERERVAGKMGPLDDREWVRLFRISPLKLYFSAARPLPMCALRRAPAASGAARFDFSTFNPLAPPAAGGGGGDGDGDGATAAAHCSCSQPTRLDAAALEATLRRRLLKSIYTRPLRNHSAGWNFSCGVFVYALNAPKQSSSSSSSSSSCVKGPHWGGSLARLDPMAEMRPPFRQARNERLPPNLMRG